MRFALVSFCLASQAVAHKSLDLTGRDFSAVSDSLSTIKSSIESLNNAVKAGGTDPAPLLKASNTLIQSIKHSKDKIDGSSELALTDAVKLTQPVQDMAKLSQDLVENLKAMRDTIEKLGYCEAVRTQTSSINDGSQALIKSVVSKVPQEAQDIANQLSSGLVKILAQAQEDFSDKNCKNSAPGAAKPSGGALPSTITGAPPATSAPGSGPPNSSAVYSPAAPETSCTPAVSGTGGMNMGPTRTDSPAVSAGAVVFAPAGGLALAVAILAM
ncbi:hypothetical protein E4U09_008180 [Claviceps aff. purpurea]|uniref:Cell wall protein n=1 Tax=Claviceps aff. purpurea TaxID=1967640 RepID=A0A9P7U7M5_9HYPO|nr:hypothetical protein E4U09_008180 [Claviceps aff. purpurea]